MKTISRLLFTGRGGNTALLLLRLFFGIMIFTHGLQKAGNFSELAASFPDPIGLGPKVSLFLITATETVGGLFIALGLLTRLSALALMFGMAVAAFVVHEPFTVSG